MKRLYYLFVLFALLWGNKSVAYDFELNGYYYNVLSATTLEVTHGDKKYSGDITIPATVTYNGKTYNVVSVGTGAFANCDNLQSIYMGNNINNVGDKAFYRCSSLKNYYFNNCKLGTYVFAYCTSLISGDIKGDIPEGTFYGCTSIESLSPKYRSIGKKAYEGCTSIKGNVEIAGTTYDVIIYDSAFADCIGITKVSLKANVTMELDAFAGCSSLETVYALNKNTDSEYTYVSGFGRAFGKCENLKNVEIEDFGNRIFCENGSIYAKSSWGYYLNYVIPDMSVYIAPDWLPHINAYAFSSIGKLKRVILSANLESIDVNAFYNCPDLKELYCYSKTPIRVNDEFYSNDIIADFNPALTGKLKLYVPKGCMNNYCNKRPWSNFIIKEFDVTSFDPYAEFEETEEVDGIMYKKTSDTEVEVIHKDDYSGDIVIPETVSIDNKEYKVTSIGKRAFNIFSSPASGCKITSIQIPNSITSIGSTAFAGCELLKAVNLPDDIACLDSGTFWCCRSLESVVLPRKLQEIKFSALSECSELKSIEIPNQVFRIGGFAFQNNKSLKTVITSHGLKEIYYYTFSSCDSLKTVVLGDNIEKIGCNAFQCCRQLSRVYSLNPTPPALNQRFDNGGSAWNYDLGNYFDNSFDWDVTQYATLYVPIGSKEAYQNNKDWGRFIHIIEFDPSTFEPKSLLENDIPAPFVGTWLGSYTIDGTNYKEQWIFNQDGTGSITTWHDGGDDNSIELFTYTFTDYSISIGIRHDNYYTTTRYPYSLSGDILTLTKNNILIYFYKQSDETGIFSIISSDDDMKAIYTIRGEKQQTQSKGINIIKMKDGTVKKVLVK